MIFEYPLGLLGLIGVPIIIIIYIIKRQYTEQTISSTYIWELSEKFLKNKKPISRLSGILSLILQLLIVVVGSLVISHPTFVIPNSANEYCFVLDGSGSMNMIQGETTRLELAKNEIIDIIDDSINGSTYSLVYVGETPRIIYQQEFDKEKAIELLNKIEITHTSTKCIDTLGYAQELFNANPSLKIYLLTDKDFKINNVNLINISNHEINYAISDVECKNVQDKIEIKGNVISYENDATINVELYVDGAFIESTQCVTTKLNNTEFNFSYDGLEYDSIKVKIKEEDSLSLDNEYIIYNVVKEHLYSTLLVSDRPYYIESILKMLGDTSVTVVSSNDYSEDMTGYGLYIFDSYNPEILPSDGAVWLFNTSASIDNAGFTVQNTDTVEGGALLEYTNKKSTIYRTLTKGVINNEIYVYKYMKYGFSRNFTTLLEYENNPIVFAGTNGYGNRQVVFAFDLHDSNMAMEFDFLALMGNFLNYSFPVILEESNYVCGDTFALNVISGCKSIRVESPLGNVSYMDTSSDISEHILTEVGTYTITVTIGEEIKVFNIYSSLNETESYDNNINSYEVSGEAKNELTDGIYNELLMFFIILVVIHMADWMVYCYEQYQLR